MKQLRSFLFICVLSTQIFLFTNHAAAELIPLPDSPLPTQHLILYINDGSDIIFTEQLTNMQEFIIPRDIPKRTGYTFFGWAHKPDAEIAEYQPGDYLRTNAEVFALYAVWRPEQSTFILFYDVNGGSNPPTAQTAPDGVLFCQFIITDSEPNRPGFDFIGWSLTPDATEAEYFSGDIFSTINKQNILYAVWQEQPKLVYTLVYNADDAENIPAVQSIESGISGCIFQLSDKIPQRSGYIFLGWAKSPNAERPEYQPGEKIQTVKTFTMLYAVWQEQPQFIYSLYFDANGGSDAPPAQIARTHEQYYTFTIPAQTPQRPGYIFLGWSQNPHAITPDFRPNTELTIITKELSLYAVWQQQITPEPEQLYILTYQANGGSNAPQTQLVYSTASTYTFKISDQKPQRDGYVFLGWNIIADDAYAEYQPGDDFLTNNTDNTLFAVWLPASTTDSVKYTLIYDANGGQNPPIMQIAYGNNANCLFKLATEKPERLNYTFLGWAFTPYAEKPDCLPGQTMFTNKKHLILYAVWQRNQPQAPTLSDLQQLLGNQAVKLICTNSASGHETISWPLLSESYSYDITQTTNGHFIACFSVKPDLYLKAYNEQLNGHQIASTSQQPQSFSLLYVEEYAKWILQPDFTAPSFNISCITPSQPTTTDLMQILETPFLVTVKCIETEHKHREHYPITYGIMSDGLQIGPVQINEQNCYTCQLTFKSQPYINAYQVSYGAHKLAANVNAEQNIELIYDHKANIWRKNNQNLPCFPVVYTPEPEIPPIYNYSLIFNANGGQYAPFPQTASSYDQTFLFVIPKETPIRPNYRFLGWAKQQNALNPVYQPQDIIILRSKKPKLTLYAVWQFNPANPDKPPIVEPKPPLDLPQTAYGLYYDSNGGNNTPAEQVQYSSATGHIFEITAEQPQRPGYIFAGWSLNPKALQSDYQAGDKLHLTQNQPSQTLYAVWQLPPPSEKPVINSPNDNSDNEDIVEIAQPEILVSNLIHKAYIQGYQDNTIKPLNYVTRAEAVVMLYRLLPEPAKTEPLYCIAEDVQTNAWYYTELAILQQNGLIQGYADGTLRPNQNLTRAEFITMLIRFNNLNSPNSNLGNNYSSNIPTSNFYDIANHWAETYIKQAAMHGWIKGYPDNSFAPNQPINRAEAVSILNNMLNRQADITKLAIYQNWPDNPENAWFYADLLEAVHTHTYIIENDTEIWLEIYPTQH